jgi:hypothetical protein
MTQEPSSSEALVIQPRRRIPFDIMVGTADIGIVRHPRSR